MKPACPALVPLGQLRLSRWDGRGCPAGVPRLVPPLPTRPDPTRINSRLFFIHEFRFARGGADRRRRRRRSTILLPNSRRGHEPHPSLTKNSRYPARAAATSALRHASKDGSR